MDKKVAKLLYAHSLYNKWNRGKWSLILKAAQLCSERFTDTLSTYRVKYLPRSLNINEFSSLLANEFYLHLSEIKPTNQNQLLQKKTTI